MDNGVVRILMDGINLLPADVVEDQQVARGSEHLFHLRQRILHPPEVGQGVMADQPVKLTRGDG